MPENLRSDARRNREKILAAASELFAQEGARQQKQETAHRVREAYYQLVQTQTQLASARESLKYLTELSALVARNLAEQTVLKSELLAVKARLSQQRYQLLLFENSIATQKEALNRLLGRDLAIDFTVEDQPAPSAEEIDVEAARKTATEQRSEVRRAGLQVKKTELDIQRQRAEYLVGADEGWSQHAIQRVLRDHAQFSQRVGSMRFDLEPYLETRLRLPNGDHFGAGITGNHRELIGLGITPRFSRSYSPRPPLSRSSGRKSGLFGAKSPRRARMLPHP